MEYGQKIVDCKRLYPMERWFSYAAEGLEQYTSENSRRVQQVFDDLINKLVMLDEDSTEEEKLSCFKFATQTLNSINDKTDIIETGEREELCGLFNSIAVSASLDPAKYGNGEGPASEWREW